MNTIWEEAAMNTLISAGMSPYTTMIPTIKKVLVVEDEPFWQLLIERSVRKIDEGIEVSISASGNQALAELEHQIPFDFIIADHKLSGSLTGLDLWNILHREHSEIPYVILSGTKKAEFFDRVMPYKVEEIPRFIEKPASVRELSEQLSDAFVSCHPTSVQNPDKTLEVLKEMKKKYYWMVCVLVVLGTALQGPSSF